MEGMKIGADVPMDGYAVFPSNMLLTPVRVDLNGHHVHRSASLLRAYHIWNGSKAARLSSG
jgi:hypothetical protein